MCFVVEILETIVLDSVRLEQTEVNRDRVNIFPTDPEYTGFYTLAAYIYIVIYIYIYIYIVIYIYIYSHPQTDLFRSIRTHQCG